MATSRLQREADHRGFDRPRHRAFALVITITLMVLLALLAIGLLSLSSVALRSSSNAAATAEARANARLALSITLGELQKGMGPDQRISANGAIVEGTGEVVNRRWTGVWDSWKAGGPDSAGGAPPSHHATIGAVPDDEMRPSHEPGRANYFRSWLVSLTPVETADV